MRWLLLLALAAGLCVSPATADDELIYLRSPDPWTKTALRFTPAHDAIVPERRVDYGRHIVIVEELHHVYYAEWPKGCAEVRCATIRHKVELGPLLNIDLAAVLITDQYGAELDRTRALSHWQNARKRAGLAPLQRRQPASTAEVYGLYKSRPAIAVTPGPDRLVQKAEQ